MNAQTAITLKDNVTGRASEDLAALLKQAVDHKQLAARIPTTELILPPQLKPGPNPHTMCMTADKLAVGYFDIEVTPEGTALFPVADWKITVEKRVVKATATLQGSMLGGAMLPTVTLEIGQLRQPVASLLSPQVLAILPEGTPNPLGYLEDGRDLLKATSKHTR